MVYRVLRIDEPEYGCEERDDSTPLLDEVTLLAPDGRRQVVLQDDSRLYRENINEGDSVLLTPTGLLEKARQP